MREEQTVQTDARHGKPGSMCIAVRAVFLRCSFGFPKVISDSTRLVIQSGHNRLMLERVTCRYFTTVAPFIHMDQLHYTDNISLYQVFNSTKYSPLINNEHGANAMSILLWKFPFMCFTFSTQ